MKEFRKKGRHIQSSRHTVMSKLRSNRGESLAEVLISTLIIALAMIMLAGMVMAAKNLIEKSETRYSDDIKEANTIEAESTSTGAGTVKIGSKAAPSSAVVMKNTGKSDPQAFKYSFISSIDVSIQKYGSGSKSYTYK